MKRLRNLPDQRHLLGKLSIVATLLAVLPLQVCAQTQLLMFERKGCAWCAQWHKEIGPIYQNSAEGKLAPLRELDINEPSPLTGSAPIYFTPTFVVVKGGVEVGRITGYPGADFFWGLLAKILVSSGAKREP